MNDDAAPELPVSTPMPAWELGWTMRGFNGPLRRARKEKGLTQKQLAVVLDMPVNHINRIELLLQRPTPPQREALADFLGLDLQQVWPDWLEPRERSLSVTAYQEMDAHTFSMLDDKVKREVAQLEDHSTPSPGATEGARLRIGQVLQTLPARRRQALELHFGLNGGQPLGYKEIGERLGICKERARQLVDMALSQLSHPVRRKALEPALEELGEYPMPRHEAPPRSDPAS